MHVADELAIRLASDQAGVFASWQLEAEGVSDSLAGQRVRAGRWVRHLPGVYGFPGVPSSYLQRLWIGWLAVGPDAVVSFESAAEVWRIPNVMRELIVLTVVHGRHHRIPGVTVHQISDVLPAHRTEHAGLPITTIPRTIVDLAAIVHPVRLHHIVEDSKHAGLVTYDAIGQCLLSIARNRKPGVRSLTRVLQVLAGNGKAKATPDSRLESALLGLLRHFGFPEPVMQLPFPGRQFVSGCVDFAYPRGKVILEADGRPWHLRIKFVKRDHERDLEAARHGWETLRLYYEHIVGDAEGTAAALRDVLRLRGVMG